ncbi:MAG: hypothetical protein PGN29_08890 [Gordonia paraffinivorans]
MTAAGASLTTTIVVATAVGVGVVPRLSPARARGGVLRHPGVWLAVVIVAMAVNQVLVTAYIHQEWGGDPSRITRYLPPGWFDLADLGPLEYVLPAWPWTVLHVQAALELPLVLLAYLLVARWFGPDVVGRVTAARWWISASWTTTFCLIEWDLHNPYTLWDIVIRVVAGLVVPLLVPVLGTGTAQPGGLVGVAVSAAALGCVILAVYDVLTLYNLGRAGRWTVPVVVALAALAAIRWWATRRSVTPGPLTASALSTLGWFVALFAVPALPLRYGLTFDAGMVSVACGSVLVVVSLVAGWDRRRGMALLGVLAAGVVGAALGALVTADITEIRLLSAAAGFVVAAGVACAIGDRRS